VKSQFTNKQGLAMLAAVMLALIALMALVIAVSPQVSFPWN